MNQDNIVECNCGEPDCGWTMYEKIKKNSDEYLSHNEIVKTDKDSDNDRIKEVTINRTDKDDQAEQEIEEDIRPEDDDDDMPELVDSPPPPSSLPMPPLPARGASVIPDTVLPARGASVIPDTVLPTSLITGKEKYLFSEKYATTVMDMFADFGYSVTTLVDSKKYKSYMLRPSDETYKSSQIPMKTNISSSEFAYTYKCLMPGMTKDNIKVDIQGKKMTVSGEYEIDSDDEEEAKYETVLHREHVPLPYLRSFNLPDDIDSQQDVYANMRNGILTIQFKRMLDKKVSVVIE